MSDQPQQTPLLELVRSVPKDLRGEWEIQWAEDGTPTGHSMAPIGRYLHDMADEIERLRGEIQLVVDRYNGGCEHYFESNCIRAGRVKTAEYTADEWCDACVLREALKEK